MSGREGDRPKVAVDLVDVVEDSWPQKRAWLIRALGFDPGAVPISRTRVETAIEALDGHDASACYDAMHAEVERPAEILRRRPVRGAVRALKRLSSEVDLFVLSGRSEPMRAVTRAWLAANDLDWIPRQRLVLLDFNQAQRSGQAAPAKLPWCARTGVEMLVDNQVVQLMRGAAEASSVARVLFSADAEEIASKPAGIPVARTWSELVRLLRRRTALA